MKVFHCDRCRQWLFFENSRCLGCGGVLAFLPDRVTMAVLEPEGDLWRSAGRRYRLCDNYRRENICNWAVPAEDPLVLCRSCRLTRVIPDLDRPGRKEAWYRLEVAKRRLLYGLMRLRLMDGVGGPDQGPQYRFLADPPGAPPVLTGHDGGVITINLAEADDAERERRRLALGEPYRTLLGHFRHESGHYYWDRLVRDSPWLEPFRQRFGDERRDYREALHNHYAENPRDGWQERYISAYAASHPWEDWAETWAHYLHLTDTLETAAGFGLSLRPSADRLPLQVGADPLAGGEASFDGLLASWLPLTYFLNCLNRGLGLADAYPFVLKDPVIDKLRFVHRVIAAARTPGGGRAGLVSTLQEVP
ncbi:zinc-binding metallopeptidase family protein [Candidatus Methylocalor cossyra]|uniref:Zinc-ribbon_6 domain-containing protein n=1 Tax=Candidatus Methylocalor cossyra TaxID=3108543 RepID=A0ABM9NF80_9GAMM